MPGLSQFNQYPCLTPVRLVDTANLAGTYFNGPLNNGVGATLTLATGTLTIDSVLVLLNDDVLLADQTNLNENGIYTCTQQGATGVSAVLTRRHDQQCIEQLLLGQYVSVSAGTAEAGSLYALVEPKPARFGIDPLHFTAIIVSGEGTAATKAASDNAQPSVASVVGATTANAVAVFADTAGSVKDATTTTTLGHLLSVTGGVTVATSNLNVSLGNVVAGSSGHAGTVASFPGTAANGELILAAVNAGGPNNTTISNGTMGQSTVYSLADIGAATGGIPVSTAPARLKFVAAAAAAGGAAAQSFTDTFCTTGSVVIGNWVTQTNPTVVQVIVPGNGSFVVTSEIDAGAGTFSYFIMK